MLVSFFYEFIVIELENNNHPLILQHLLNLRIKTVILV